MGTEKWIDYKLGEITTWRSGGTPRKDQAAFWGGNIPWISAKNFPGISISNSDTHITEAGLEAGSRLARLNSILILVRGGGLYNDIPVGIVSKPVAFNQDLKSIEVDEEILLPHYLLYWLIGNKPLLYTKLEQTGIGAGKFDTNILRELVVQVPPLTIQKKIVRMLSDLDEKIELNRQTNETLEAMVQALFREWFVHFRFPGDTGERVESELGMIPAGWRVGKVGEVCEANLKAIGKKDSYEEIEYIEISGVSHGELRNTTRIAYQDAPSRAKRKVAHGDVLVSTVRPDRGAYCLIVYPPNNLIASTGFAVLTPKNGCFGFLYPLITSPESITRYGHVADGAAYPTINPSDILEMGSALPPEKLMGEFHQRVEGMLLESAKSITENKILEEARNQLLRHLIPN